MTEAPMLELDRLSVSYMTRRGPAAAVLDVSLSLREGESLGLVGESGCGKSTVALAIMRHYSGKGRLAGGRVLFRGRDMAELSPGELRRIRGSGIAMVYQEPMAALNPSLTIGAQLAEIPVFHRGLGWAAARERALGALADVNLPDPERILGSYPHQLSGGQQQRAVIAMALIGEPQLLILDEPTTGLDVTVEAGVVELIAGLRATHRTGLLYISHNLGLIARVCDRVAVMYSGEIVEEGNIAEVFAKPRHPYTQGLFRCLPEAGADKERRPLKPIRGTVSLPHERPRGCFFAPRCDHFREGLCDDGHVPVTMVDAGSAHAVRCRRWAGLPPDAWESMSPRSSPARSDAVALDVRELSKHYAVEEGLFAGFLGGRGRRVRANDRVSFRATRGRTLAIVGESGCGKSTLARVLMGLEAGNGGTLEFAGVDLSCLPIEQRSLELLSALQMVFQNPDETLNPSFTVGRQIGRVIAKLMPGRSRAEIRIETRRLLEQIRLPAEFASRMPRQLSGGQKQRIGIARAFAGNPALVVADEPVSSLDVSVRAAITELLMEVQRASGTTLIVISHDLSLVRYIADRVVVMYLGQVMEAGTTDEVYAPPYHPYTEALLSAVPIPDPRVRQQRVLLEGELPSALDPPKGCPFHTRCPRKLGPVCESEQPKEQVTEAGHRIACHIPLAELAKVAPVFQVARSPALAGEGIP
ncbi:MAG: ABC transporter ATP-binding protein [Proteobacteria bacterium]|nr:ABC transporter ATP-binding protein [Pseudomonadota bacterium]MBI3505763.1 ABC transporter ATP-binding protein [Pseudomonadota bacterium]